MQIRSRALFTLAPSLALLAPLAAPTSGQCLVSTLEAPLFDYADIEASPGMNTLVISRSIDGAGFLLTSPSGDGWVEQLLVDGGGQARIWGDQALIGAPDWFNFSFGNVGGASWMERDPINGWEFKGWLTGSTLPTDFDSEYGTAVSVHGDIAAVGGPGYNNDSGLVTVWRLKSFGGELEWTDPLAFTGFNNPGDRWGASVAVTSVAGGGQRDALLIGSPGRDDLAQDGGAIYLYLYNPSTGIWEFDESWVEAQADAGLGEAVALDGDRAFATVPGFDTGGGADNGVGYLLEWDGSAYVLVNPAPMVTGQSGERLGSSIALDGDLLLLGSPRYDGLEADFGLASAQSDSGGASLFRWDGAAFQPVTERFYGSPDAATGDLFGSDVAISNDVLIITAPGSNDASVRTFDSALESWDWDQDLGGAAAGTLGAPVAFGEGSFCLDEEFDLHLGNVPSSSFTWLVIGFTTISLPLPGVGGLLVPAPDVISGPFVTDANGELALPLTLGSPLPSGLELAFQFWTFDPAATGQFSASNGFRGTLP